MYQCITPAMPPQARRRRRIRITPDRTLLACTALGIAAIWLRWPEFHRVFVQRALAALAGEG